MELLADGRMRTSSSILTVGAAALLGGCAVGPAYVTPQVAAPPAFMGGPAAEGATGQDRKVDLVSWWRSFDDPLLTQMVDRALLQNLDLQQARARVVQARAALRNANAQLLPAGQITGQASENYQSLETPQGRIASALPGFQREAQGYEATSAQVGNSISLAARMPPAMPRVPIGRPQPPRPKLRDSPSPGKPPTHISRSAVCRHGSMSPEASSRSSSNWSIWSRSNIAGAWRPNCNCGRRKAHWRPLKPRCQNWRKSSTAP